MLYGDQTKVLRRGLFDVQNGVGLGRHEEAYHQAFKVWLDDAAYRAQASPRTT